MNRIVGRAGVALAVAVLIAGCSSKSSTGGSAGTQSSTGGSAGTPSGSAAPTKYVIGQSSPQMSDAGQQVILAGLKDWVVSKQGWMIISKNANADAQQQARDMEALIAQKVNAIIVDPVDGAAICPSIQKAEAAGIPVFGVDRRVIGCKARVTVLSDNYNAGKDSGTAMVKLLTARYGMPKGKVLEIQGDLSGVDAQQRGAGFDDVLKQYPDIAVSRKPTKWTANEFAAATRDVASSQNIDGIYMHSDCVGAVPVTSALKQIGKLFTRDQKGHIFLTGVDGCKDTLKAFRDGYFDATSSQPLTDFGAVTIEMKKLLGGGTLSTDPLTVDGANWSPATPVNSDSGLTVFLHTTPVTPANVDDKSLWANHI